MNGKIITGLILIIGIFISIAIAIQVGQGEFKTVYIVTLAIFGGLTMVIIGIRLWYILPFVMVASLPAVPIVAGRSVNMGELGIAAFSLVYMISVLKGQSRFSLNIRYLWPMLLFAAWVLLIAILDGSGLAIFGSSSMGGRGYLTVFIGVFGMILLSQITINEKEAKRVVWVIFAAYAISGVFQAIRSYFGMDASEIVSEFYSWQQGLSLPALISVIVLFTVRSPKQVILNPLNLLLYLLILSIAAYSGKRMVFAACCIIPIVACFWHRQTIWVLFIGMVGVLIMVGAIVTQNEITALPKSLQRVLQFLPADWDMDVNRSAGYSFRETLNRLAIKEVEEHPLIGSGLGMTVKDYAIMEDVNYVVQIMDPDDDPLAYPHAVASNWHSTWLGLAAILGIPGAIIWLAVQFKVIRSGWRLGHYWGLGSWRSRLAGVIFIGMFVGLMSGFTSGSLVRLVMREGMYLGLLCALMNSFRVDLMKTIDVNEAA